MRLCNIGHAGWLIEHGDHVVLVDPLVPGDAIEPRELAAIEPLLARVTHVVATSADPLHGHAPTLRKLLPGRHFVVPRDVLPRLARVGGAAASVIELPPVSGVTAAGLTWTALPDPGPVASTVLVSGAGEAVWFVGAASVDRNRALLLANRIGDARAIAVVDGLPDHPLDIAHGAGRGFPAAAVAERVRVAGALREAGFTVVLAGGVVGRGQMQWIDAFAEPIAIARLARELDVTAAVVGRWLDARGAVSGPALPTSTRETQPFDPSRGIPEIGRAGAFVPGLDAIAGERYGRLYERLAYGYAATLAEWAVHVELRELAADGDRRTLIAFGRDGVTVATDPPSAGTITITASAHALAALVAGERSAEELSASGELRTSERVVSTRRGVARPSWVGLKPPGETVAWSPSGHVLTPLTLADLLRPDARPPSWPQRWPGER